MQIFFIINIIFRDCFVLPSQYETFSVGFLEAWSAEKPVIATDVGGISDLIEDAWRLVI